MEVAAALHLSSGLRRVVGSLPPAEEFTRPVYGHVHQEQFSAGETTENIPDFPVVQEQVLVQAIPRWSMSLLCCSTGAVRGLMGSLFWAVYTGTRPGVAPAIWAGKGWRGRREVAPRCSATQ